MKLRQLLVRQVLLLGATYLACTHIPPAYWTPTAANIKPAIRHFVVRAVPTSVNLRRESGGDSCWHQIINVLRMSTVLLEGASRTYTNCCTAAMWSREPHSKACFPRSAKLWAMAADAGVAPAFDVTGTRCFCCAS